MLRVLLLAALLGTPPPAIQVQVDATDGGLRVTGGFDVNDLDGRTSWSVLTSYDRLAEIVPEFRASKVIHRGSADVIVEQDATAHVLFVTREVHLLLDVRETPRTTIAFRDLSHRDFLVFRGTWTLSVAAGVTHVRYALDAEPREQAPDLLMSSATRSSVREQLEHLRAEIVRRLEKKGLTQ